LDWWNYLGEFKIKKRSKAGCRRKVVFKIYFIKKSSFNILNEFFSFSWLLNYTIFEFFVLV
jgi:hypothetical protein